MKWFKPVLLGLISILFVGLLAFIAGYFFGEKPLAWVDGPLLKNEDYLKGFQGTWRNHLTILGHQKLNLPNQGRGSEVKVDGNRLTIFPDSPGGVVLENTFQIDTTQSPPVIELTIAPSTPTQEKWIGILEINESKTRVRFQLRNASLNLGRPTVFDRNQGTDYYQEYSR